MKKNLYSLVIITARFSNIHVDFKVQDSTISFFTAVNHCSGRLRIFCFQKRKHLVMFVL